MKNLLILLTSVYPTSWGDMFIHEELPYLSEVFDRILVFPVNSTGSAKPRNDIPGDARVILTNRRPAARARLRDALYTIRPQVRRSPAVRRDISWRARTSRQKLYTYFAEGRALQFAQDSWSYIDTELREGSYDEAVVYSYWMAVPARAALMIRDRIQSAYPDIRTRSYSRGHGYDIYDEASSAGMLPFRRELIENMNALFPCSDYGVSYMKERFLRPGEQSGIYVSRLGTKDPLARPKMDRDTLWHRKFSDPGNLKLVSCGRVVPVKRIQLLAQSLSRLKDSGINLSWTHFGGGSGLDELRQYTEAELQFMHVDLRGQTDRTDILEAYLREDFDFFVNVSSSEGVPVSVMEASSCAIPSLCTDVGGTAEIVKDGESGWLWPGNVTPETIAATLTEKAGMSAESRKRAGHTARLLWEALSSAERNYREMAAILAGRRPAGPVPAETAQTISASIQE